MNAKNDPFPAHIRRTDKTEVRQSVSDHNRQTGQYAWDALAVVNLGGVAKLAGLLHDMGKYTARYRKYIEDAVSGVNPVVRGSVNHSFAAVRYLLEHYHGRTSPCGPLTAELLAYATGAHHGLFDCVDADHRSGFQHRREKEDICYEEAAQNFLQYCAGEEELNALFSEAEGEVERAYRKLIPLLRQDETASEEVCFYLGMLARLLLSAVIEGDRRDTAEFEQDMRFPQERTPEELRILWETLSDRIDRKLGELPHRTKVEKARCEISDRCRAFAEKPGGIYRLNVPTGAGKTLSSLRYALAHAARYGKSRIIFTSPLLSILDQNTAVIRRYIGDDNLILEHHSNVVQEKGLDTPEAQEELDRREFLTATWESPIIVSTLVQLLNTLFSGRGSCIRRFHSLSGSIIVIDEVQTVPSHLLTLFHLALGFLSEVCGATVLLCSATQPCSEAARHPIAVPTPDMVPYDRALWQAFRRTELRDAGAMPLAEIPAFAAGVLAEADSLLIVCNKKGEAASILRAMEALNCRCFHLSAAMCMAHRRTVLAEMEEVLERLRKEPGTGRKVVCVSTQVIEAGVDISFARVIRLMAGMDSVVQSAGRCNRNGGNAEPVPVFALDCMDEELKYLPDIQWAKNAALGLLTEFRRTPEEFDGDLASDAAIRFYYQWLYHKEIRNVQDGPVLAGERKTSLFSLLSANDDFVDVKAYPDCQNYLLAQAFRTAGKAFAVFDGDTTDVLVPYGDGKELILTLGELRLPYDLLQVQALLEKAKPYTVSLYPWQKKKLEKERALIPLCGGSILALQEGYYSPVTGLTKDQEDLLFQEV